MLSGRRIYLSFVLFAGLFSAGKISFAVQFEPGIGLGLEYTDNARLTPVDQIDDLITASYVGARVIEDGGALRYDAAATYNKHIYLKDTYPDVDYYNLNGGLNWEMVKNRFNWVLTDRYYQRAIVALDSNTPNNLQNANVFTFGANYFHPVSGRQSITLVPMYSQYYYDTTITSNKQLSLSANWDYQMSRLMSIGLSFSTRNLDYKEQSIEDTRFTDIGGVISGQRRRSTFSMYLGTTIVKREKSGEGSGISGYFNWTQNLTARSTFETNISSEITDTSRASVSAVDEPGNGNGNDVQLATDVIRYSIINLAYIRDDATLNTRLWGRYNSINYSDSPLDRVVHAFGLQSSYPVTQLLSSSIYMNYNHTEQIDTGEINGAYIVGGNLGYSFSRKLRGLLDLKYRKKESTSVSQNYNEFSAFASLVYGFGNVLRPTRSGGY